MDGPIIRLNRWATAALCIAVTWFPNGACGGSPRKALPKFSDVKETVLRHFELLPDYRPGDIIARSEVEPLFAQLKWMGWTVADRTHILKMVPADHDYLIRNLRTPSGRRFMRRISSLPNAYDRLERLSRMPHGRQTVHDLINKVGGEEMIEYLTTTSGGKNMGKQLSNSPTGRDFNRPTGRIYTADLLLARLQKSYEAAKQSRTKAGK